VAVSDRLLLAGQGLRSRLADCFDAELGRLDRQDYDWFVPRLTPLERRIVLNATAELSETLGLLLQGDDAANQFDVRLVDGGQSFQVFDGQGNVIPIDGHDRGAAGSETDPLPIDQITEGQLRVDLGAGHDLLRLQLPDGLDVQISGDAGVDQVEIDASPAAGQPLGGRLGVVAERIDFKSSGAVISLADRETFVDGEVRFSSAATTPAVELELGSGSLNVSGAAIFDGVIRLSGEEASIDLENASVSALDPETRLFIELGTNNDSQLRFGKVDATGGSALEDLRLESVSSASFSDPVQLLDQFKVNASDAIFLGTSVDAGSVDVQGETIEVAGRVQSTDGTVLLSADGTLQVSGTIDSTPAEDAGTISLSARQIHFDDAGLRTSGANVSITGPVSLTGKLEIDTAVSPSVNLGQALLDLSLATTPQPDTEFVIVDNQGDQDVIGRFRFDRDVDGNPLPTARVLDEGDPVLLDFGVTAAAVPAFITYFGGDGNDVAIVTSGSRTESVGPVTLVNRRGGNIEIRNGLSLADAESADPTVRPIAGLNGNELRIDSSLADSQLYVDIDGFVDPGPENLNVAFDIRFDATASSGTKLATVFDSDLTTSDVPNRFAMSYASIQNATLEFDHLESVADDYSLRLVGVDEIHLDVAGSELDVQLTPQSDTLAVEADAADRTRFLLSSLSGSSQLTFQHPDQLLRVEGGAGADAFSVDSLGEGIDSAIQFFGGEDHDRIDWKASAELGNPTNGNDFVLSSERIRYSGELSWNAAGDVLILADQELTLDGSLRSGIGSLRIHSTAATSDLGGAFLQSLRADRSVVLTGGDFLLGDLITPDGEVLLGDPDHAGIGDVQQASGTSLDVAHLFVKSFGTLQLDRVENQFESVDVVSAQSVALVDGQSDLVANVNSQSDVWLQVDEDLLIGTIDAGDGMIVISATQIEDAGGFVGADLSAGELDLASETGIGNLGALSVTNLGAVNAVTESGSIRLDVQADRTVNLRRIETGGGGNGVIEITHSGDSRLGIERVANFDGDVSIETASASIDLFTSTLGDSLSLGKEGALRIFAGGEADVVVRGGVSSDSGDVTIAANRNLVFTADGRIDSRAGQVTLAAGNRPELQSSVLDLQDGSVVDVGEGVASLTAPGNVFVSSIVSTNSGQAIEIIAGAAVRDSGDAAPDLVAEEGLVRLRSQNGIGVGDALETVVGQLIAEVTSEGPIQVNESTDIVLTAVRTANGAIDIQAGTLIRIVDSGTVEDGDSLREDVEVSAGGEHGRISLEAAESIQLGNLSQLFAEQVDFGAVTLQATEVRFGEQVQIETGNAVGVARYFAPRPESDRTGTAFYDATTVTTNRLTQAAVNDATGVLTVDVGREGERGLTIQIDWGAETNRFQQIDHLSGDAPPLRVSHLYLEDDILSSRLNGRGSATDPLEVRFAVRHHESIQVFGALVRQGDSGVQAVPGGVISSTDDPQTPQLDDGEARFIIPNLTIPVAFFPVRDVIPAIEPEPIVVATETTYALAGTTLEGVEAVVSSPPTRDEYFQLRVLSPDPSGGDLVPPTRLPDDIIGGDRLRDLFESLPDGRYEIQYVLGDGNVRTILNVEIRDGKPIVPGEEIEGGPLELVPVEDPEASPEQPEGAGLPEQRPRSSESEASAVPERSNASVAAFSAAHRFLMRAQIDPESNRMSESSEHIGGDRR
jgi:hypothetical protein